MILCLEKYCHNSRDAGTDPQLKGITQYLSLGLDFNLSFPILSVEETLSGLKILM